MTTRRNKQPSINKLQDELGAAYREIGRLKRELNDSEVHRKSLEEEHERLSDENLALTARAGASKNQDALASGWERMCNALIKALEQCQKK